MTWYDKIKDWSSLDIHQRYNILMGGIIVALSGIIVHLYVFKIPKINEDNSLIIQRIVDRYTFREAALQNKLDLCNQGFLQYLKENEKKYTSILFKSEELKIKINKEYENSLE